MKPRTLFALAAMLVVSAGAWAQEHYPMIVVPPGKGPYQEYFALEYTREDRPQVPLSMGPAATRDASIGHWGLNE